MIVSLEYNAGNECAKKKLLLLKMSFFKQYGEERSEETKNNQT